MTCYCINFGVVSTNCAGSLPCGEGSGFTQCCAPEDSCHPNGFCYSTNTLYLAATGTNWYLGGCTDSTWNDASCPRPCEDLAKSDVTYNESTGSWACCRNGPNDINVNSDCGNPGNETFSAPPPAAILAASYGTSSTKTSAITSSNDLSIGAKAGIGIGAVLASLLIIVLVAMIFSLRRKQRRTPQMLAKNSVRIEELEDKTTFVSDHQTKHIISEMDGHGRIMTSELP